MDTRSYKTILANDATANKQWLVIDATDQTLGRFSSKVASLLRGKHKTNFTPHSDAGDYVIVINAEKVKLTGKKITDKMYIHYTGYPGGQRFATPKELLVRRPIAVVEKAVKGMLPKTKLGRAIYGNLHVYEGAEHPHQAQNPKKVETNK